MSTPAAAVLPPRTFRDVWLISAGHGLTHWYPATFYVLLPLIGKELGLSYTQIGFLMSAQHIAGALSNLPGGMIVDSIGKKGYLMAASLFWVGFPYALMSMTNSMWMLVICLMLVGIGNNLWHPAAIPTLAHQYPQRKGLVLSFHGMGGNIGEALAPLAAGSLLAWFSWREVVVINVVPGLVMAVLILVMVGALTTVRDGDKPRKEGVNAGSGSSNWNARQYLRDLGSLLRNRALMLICVSGGFRTLTQVGLMVFLPVYLAYEQGYSPIAVGVCMTVLQVAGLIAGPIAGHVSDKFGRRHVVLSSMVLTGLTIIGMVFAGQSFMFIVFVALVGFFLYAMRPVMQAWAVENTPKRLAGTGVGLQFTILAIGGSIAPATFGVIADAWGVYTAFYFLAGTIIAANLLVVFVPKDSERAVA
ncbi:MAG: MFS transporter [Burkholderiales bacterium]|nr:MFS transporter [Burkholderiales bacterium]MDP2399123.1 MFS transporter [Burkholderiales bacterium]